jgi:hypothetical protein
MGFTLQQQREREVGRVELASWSRQGLLPGPAQVEEKEFLLPKAFFIQPRNEFNSGKNTLGPQKIMEIFLKVDLNIWHDFCIGHFDQKSTIF